LWSAQYSASRNAFAALTSAIPSAAVSYQSILMRPVIPLDAPFRLWRTRRDDLDAQRRAHAAELRQGLGAGLPFLLIRPPHIDILPVGVECPRNSVARNPRAQEANRGPNGLLRADSSQAPAGRVVHQRQQTALRTAIFKPGMNAAIELHQLAEVRHAGATTSMRTALARPAPQPGRQHPSPQRFVIDRDPVFTRQMLGGERRPESLVHAPAVFLANQRQHPSLRPRLRRPIRGASRAPMFEALRTLGPVAPVQALRLPVAHLH
jgi:hypothetical protein